MVDRIQKTLLKLSAKERKEVFNILEAILSGRLERLDVKKLAGNTDVYRVRKGKVRVIFLLSKTEDPQILAIERRSDNTYRKF